MARTQQELTGYLDTLPDDLSTLSQDELQSYIDASKELGKITTTNKVFNPNSFADNIFRRFKAKADSANWVTRPSDASIQKAATAFAHEYASNNEAINPQTLFERIQTYEPVSKQDLSQLHQFAIDTVNEVKPNLEGFKQDVTSPVQDTSGQVKQLSSAFNAARNRALEQEQTAAQVNKLYDPLLGSGREEVKRSFAPLRARAIEEDIQGGRSSNGMRSGASLDPSSAIGQVDANEGNALSKVISDILAQKASGTLDLTKFNTTTGLARDAAKQSASEFNQNLALNKQTYADQLALGNKQLSVAEAIGRAQADAKKPGIFDYINTALAGLNTASNTYNSYDAYKTRKDRENSGYYK